MAQLLKNNAYGVLASGITDSAASMTLVDASRFDAPTGGDYYLVTLIGFGDNGAEDEWEIVKVTAKALNTLTVVRAQEGTTAVAWPGATQVQLRLTAGTMATKANIDSPTFTGTVSGITQAMVGLPNADNTSDVAKPISTATQTELNGKAPLTGAGTSGTWPISTTGNAATATKLATARTINGMAFDGSGNIAVQVSWTGGITGKPAVIAEGATQAEARVAIGAGTSSLTLGASAGTALAGDTAVLPEAPSDGKTYGRKDATWVESLKLGTTSTTALAGDTVIPSGGNTSLNVGYLNIPQNSQSSAYTCVLADAGKHILHPAADTTARTFTIPANASVAYPIGTALTFVNQNGTGGIVTIAITTDTMRLAGAGTTGTRTLARNGVATAVKITATEWIISGSGLT